jgi:hypothetical protein
MPRLGHRPKSRRLWWLLGASAVVLIVASLGTPNRAGCGGSFEDDKRGVAVDLDDVQGVASTAADVPVETLSPILVSTFCPTAGAITSTGPREMRVSASGMRGVVAGDSSRSVEIAFVFRGPSRTVVALANGEMRQQIGLKLRARDTCNVVYVMWHVAPTPGVAVSVKSNPGLTTHAECGDRGYVNLRSTISAVTPVIARDQPHVLRADLDGDLLRVRADGVEVWEGRLPREAFAFDGPVGTRSDNGTFDFALRVPGGVDRRARCTNPGTELAH